MKQRPLPVVEKIALLNSQDPKAAAAYVEQIVLDLFRAPGFQLVLSTLQAIEAGALEALRARQGNPPENLALIFAADYIRKQLTALLPVGTELKEDEPEEEFEAAEVYESGFDIPYPQPTGA